jgi:aryl-alcohol dehydrogenase-like predicted oxidoreductase
MSGAEPTFKPIRGGVAMTTKVINRREFMTEVGLKVAGTSLLLNQLSVRPAFAGKEPAPGKSKNPTMEYRTLGRTGLKVSAVSFGVMRLKEPAVLFNALDSGINYFDTAHGYQNGNNEKMLGKALKEYGRQKAFIATKAHPFYSQQQLAESYRLRDRKVMGEMIEESLKRLQTDYVDVFLVHNIMDKSWPSNEEVMAFVEKIKKEGKARFVGISCHDPRVLVDVVDHVAKSTVYDLATVWFNFTSPPEHAEALRRAKKTNTGIVAMKTQMGGYEPGSTATLTPVQAALKWSLDQDFVDCAISGMVNNEQVAENIGVVGKKVGWSDRKTLSAHYNSIKHHYCIMCGKCT